MTETNEPTFGDLWVALRDGVKTGANQSITTAAADHGVTPRELLTEVGIAIVEGRLMWRAARRGDVARTIAWATLVMRGHNQRTARRQRVLLERQMDTLIDRSIR